MKNNCLYYAYQRYKQDGGYLITRRSRHFIIPHFLWSPDLKTFYHFVPTKPKKGIKVLFDAIWFEGYVKVTDE